MPDIKKARAVGLNHVALEVGDIESTPAVVSFSNPRLRSLRHRRTGVAPKGQR